jgi:tetratricopeptide (TPR) repeat protein
MTRNVEAYDAYLAGRSLMNQPSRENVSRAIEHLEQAVALDPDFAVAWNVLAGIYGAAALTFIPERAGEFSAKRDAARSRVVELVPGADYALSIKAEQSGDRVEVERLLKQALSQNPENSDTNLGYGQFLNGVGRPTEAIEYLQRAVRVEPLASGPYLFLSIAYEISGNSTAAATAFKAGGELAGQPAVYNSGLLVLALEENNRELIDKYVTLVLNTELLGNINRAESRDINQVMQPLLDTPETAVAELRGFLTDPAYNNPFNRLGIGVWASYFGEHELALQTYMESGQSGWPIWRPIHKGMRRLPGFKDLVTKIGLVDYWRTTGHWGEFCRPVGNDDFECK